MTLRRRSLILAAAATAAGTAPAARAQRGEDREARESIVDLLRDVAADRERPLAGVSVAWLYADGRVSRAWAGWRTIGARHPDDSVAIEAETLFRVASVSKLALALAMLRMHEARVLDLDADLGPLLRHRLRHPLHDGVAITPRLILSHRSGLLDHGLTLPLPDGEALRRALSDRARWGPEAPGQMFLYGSFGFVVLATAMEAAARQPFDALMQRWLFEPLGVRAAYSPEALGAAQREQLATLYRLPAGAAGWVPQYDSPRVPVPAIGQAALEAIGENASVHAPHGGLRISVPGLARITQLLMQQGRHGSRRLISAEGYAQLLRPHWTLGPGSPGDTAQGLYRSWSLGLQRFTDVRDAQGGDRLYPRGRWRGFGHLGNAYGLRAGLLFGPPGEGRAPWGLVYVINGTSQRAEQSPGRYSSLLRSEERLIEGLLDTLHGGSQTG